jgi:hypothetical protein
VGDVGVDVQTNFGMLTLSQYRNGPETLGGSDKGNVSEVGLGDDDACVRRAALPKVEATTMKSCVRNKLYE